MSLSERILASAWGLETVPKTVLSWHSSSSTAAHGVGTSGTSGRGPMTGANGLEEGLREDPGSLRRTQGTVGRLWVRGGGCM